MFLRVVLVENRVLENEKCNIIQSEKEAIAHVQLNHSLCTACLKSASNFKDFSYGT